MIKSNIEIFKDIPGYEGLYQVSNIGRVKSLPRNGTINKERILNQENSKGYKRVSLNKNNKAKHFSVHRLVAEAFIPNPLNKPQIDHINTVKDDNRVINLRWCTAKENQRNPITLNNNIMSKIGKKFSEERKNKLKGPREKIKRGKHPGAKKVLCINTGEIFNCIRDASDKYDAHSISLCCKGKVKYSGIYNGEKLKWKYI